MVSKVETYKPETFYGLYMQRALTKISEKLKFTTAKVIFWMDAYGYNIQFEVATPNSSVNPIIQEIDRLMTERLKKTNATFAKIKFTVDMMLRDDANYVWLQCDSNQKDLTLINSKVTPINKEDDFSFALLYYSIDNGRLKARLKRHHAH